MRAPLFILFALWAASALGAISHKGRCIHVLLGDAPVHRDDRAIYQTLPIGPIWLAGSAKRSQLQVEGFAGPGRFRTFHFRRGIAQLHYDETDYDRARTHHDILNGTVVRSATDRYEHRRGEWGNEFIDTLKGLGPFFIDDAIGMVVVDENDLVQGGIRLVHAPYGWKDGEIVAAGPTVVALGYREDAGFRPEALPRWKNGEIFVPESSSGQPRPPRWLPGEEILDIEAIRPRPSGEPDQNGVRGGIAWEFTSFFVNDSLPEHERIGVWTQLWLSAVNELFRMSPQLAFTDQIAFSYGTADSVRLYAQLGGEKLRQYHSNGRIVGPGADGFAPPILRYGKKWWGLEFPLVHFEQFAVNISGRHGRFGLVDASEQLHLLTGSRAPYGMLWNPQAILPRLADDTYFVGTGTGASIAVGQLAALYRQATVHEELARSDDPLTVARSTWALRQTLPMLRTLRDDLLHRLAEGTATERQASAEVFRRRKLFSPNSCDEDGRLVVDALSKAAAFDPNTKVRTAAYDALIPYESEAAPAILDLAAGMLSPDEELRRHAARAVANILVAGGKAPPELDATLLDAADSSDEVVTANALLALRFTVRPDKHHADRLLHIFVKHSANNLAPEADLSWTFGPPLSVGWAHAAAAYRRARHGAPHSTSLLAKVLSEGPYDFRGNAAQSLCSSEYGDDAQVEGIALVLGWLESHERWTYEERRALKTAVEAVTLALPSVPTQRPRLLAVLERWLAAEPYHWDVQRAIQDLKP